MRRLGVGLAWGVAFGVVGAGCTTPAPAPGDDAAVRADTGVGPSTDVGIQIDGFFVEADASVPADAFVEADAFAPPDAFVEPDAFVSLCGNDAMDLGEVCDDGNTDPGDGCRADCLGTEQCGDGLADFHEYCPGHAPVLTALTGTFAGAGIADGDGDGDRDVLVLLDGHVQLFPNAGDATLGAPFDTHATELGQLLDLRGGPEADLLLPRAASIDVLPNDGTGHFGTAISSPVPGFVIAAGHVDGDADLDLVASTAATECTPFFNDGSAHFTAGTPFDCGTEVRQILLGDVDDDGRTDAVFLHDTSTDNVSVVLGDGGGGFGTRAMLTTQFPNLGALGDIDADGDLDLVHGVMVFPVRLQVVRWMGTAFQAGTPVTVTAFPGPVTLVDVDLDGASDLFNFGFTSGTPYVLFRASDGTGAFTRDLDTGLTSGARFEDMNGDGALDVVSITATSISIDLADP